MGKAERTKQQIIERVAPLFNKKGISGTSIDEVLSFAKISKRGFYMRFESKDSLSRDVADFLLNTTLERTSKSTRKGSAKKKLLSYLQLYKNAIGTGREVTDFFTGGCPILNLGVESDDAHNLIRNKVKQAINTTLLRLAEIIEDGMLSGELRKDLDSKTFALKIFTLIEGGMMICKVVKSNVPMLSVINMLKEEINANLVI